MIPAAFEYLRAHSPDEAFAFLQQHGAEARVLAGGQSLIPAMRFRLARPAVLVDINSVNDLSYARIDGKVLALGAIARDVDIERAPWIGDRRWSLIHDASSRGRRSGRAPDGHGGRQSVPQRSVGDWTAVAIASRAEVVVRGKSGNRQVKDRRFPRRQLHDRLREKARWRWPRNFPCPTIRTAGSYQKVERKVGDFATAAAAVQVSLNEDGTIRAAGVALSAAGATAVRVDDAERLLAGAENRPRN